MNLSLRTPASCRLLVSLLAVVALALSLLGTPVAPASGAVPATKVALTSTVPANAASGTVVTVGGSVIKGVRRQKVQLQLRNGGAWTVVASALLPASRKFAIRTKVFLGVNELRVVAKPFKRKARGSTSVVKVTHGLPVAPKEIGPDTPFRVTGRLATAVARPVLLQADDGGWKTVASGTSSRTGEVSLMTSQTQATTYRIVAPAVRVGGVNRPAVTTKHVRVNKGIRPPAFTVSSLPPAFRNRMYNYFEGFSQSSQWDFAVVAGQLPPGIELDDEGYLDGTPTVKGSYTFTVRITAPSLPAAQRQFTIDVAPNGQWLDTDLDVQAVDNEGRFATLTCGSSCTGSPPPQVIDLTTQEVETAPWPEDVEHPAAAQVEGISGDGRHVVFFAGVDNWVDNQAERSALYLWDRVGGSVEKLSDGGPPLYSGSPHGGLDAAIDADGSTVVYQLTHQDTDDNGDADDTAVYVWERGAGTTNLSADPRIADDFLIRPEISDDGDTVAFVQRNWEQPDRIRLYDRSADTFTWVSAELDSRVSFVYSFAANGESVVYPRAVGTVPGDPDVTIWGTVLWDRDAGVTRVVSETVSGAPLRSRIRLGSAPSVQVSGDGRFVYFESNGDYFENDDPSVRFPYFWDRSTDAVTPMPFVPDDGWGWPEVYERWAETSYDGRVVFVRGHRGGLDRPLYRFQRDARP